MMATPLPDEIGPYRVLRPIASGGMAEVYEVEERNSGEHLALKLLVQKGGALPRFNREYEAMIRLNHPNIARVYNYGLHGDLPWMSMELVKGTPIQAYAKRVGKPGSRERTAEVIRLAHDLAMALDHIHYRGLVHRDLKSANVLVLPDGRVKLIDFGTARVSDPVQQITRDGEFIGTFAYASPEQMLNLGVDGRSDLYSFGVLLFRLATGKRPFESKDLGELARMHVRKPPPAPTSVIPDLPPALEEVILCLLAKQPEERPQSGAEVAEALEAVAGHALRLPGTLDVDLASERLVGRESQLRQLWSFLDGTPDPTRSGPRSAGMALVVGLQGSGRHQVMQAMEREVNARGWRPVDLLFRRGAEDINQVTNMLISMSRSFGGNASPDLVDHVQAIRAMARSTSLSVAERLETLRTAGAALMHARTVVDDAPLVLLTRGLQHAGAVGFEAIVGLREELRALGTRVFLIGDCTENADDPHSIARKRLPDALRVKLPPMSVRQVALLVGALLHRRPPPASVARQIYGASGGLPTYVEEVVKGMVSDGILQVSTGDQNRIEWAQRDGRDIKVPSGARERVIDQLAGLPADRRRSLEALALCGGQGSVRVLAGALGCRPSELMPALNELSHRGWITLGRRGKSPYATWRQILAQPVVLDQLNPCRRRVLERMMIEQVAEEPAFAAQIRLLLDVGRFEQALLRSRDWAIHHLSKNRPQTALEVLDFVVPTLDDVDADATLVGQLHLLHATCLLMARPTDPNTSRSLQRAKGLTAAGDVHEAEVHLTRARVQRVIGHYPNFRKQLMEAWHTVEHNVASPLAANIATQLGWSNRVSGQVDEAAMWHGRARRIAAQVGDPVVRAHADSGVAAWQCARGLLVEAERTAGSALRTFVEADDLRGIAEGLPTWTESLRHQGRFTEALALLYDQTASIREGENPTFYVRLLLANAWCEVDLGRLGRAQEWVDELGATLRRGEHLNLRLEAHLVWGRILVASGLHDDAVLRLREVIERADAANLTVTGQVARALEAEALWALGDQRTALTRFARAIRVLHDAGDIPALAAACISQARAMAESVDPDLVFRPIDDWLDHQPAVCARIERQIARGRYLRAMGKPDEEAFARAEAMIDQVASTLDATDAAALRLHPWTRHIRRVKTERGKR